MDRDPIFNSRDPNRVPKTPLKKPGFYTRIFSILCKNLNSKNADTRLSCLLREKFMR